jgi:hypothetical protein
LILEVALLALRPAVRVGYRGMQLGRLSLGP